MAPLLALAGCLVNTALRDERLDALEGCEAVPGFEDGDGDGFGDRPLAACPGAVGWSERDGDCDDADPSQHPAAPEVCDGFDQDCDGVPDDDAVDAITSWFDGDGDGWGDPGTELVACGALPDDRAPQGGDCADVDPSRFPGASERCNGVDDDCDGETDEVGALDGYPVWLDADGDGYGDPAAPDTACAGTDGVADNPDDCDDTLAAAHPGGSDSVLLDGDCDGDRGTVAIAAREVFGLTGEFAGSGVAAAGDFDGDGRADWAVGTPGTDDGGYDSGAVWIVSGWSGPGIDTALGSHGWYVAGEFPGHLTGAVIRGGGDVNGDGFDDLLVGSVMANGGRGGAWLVWGAASPVDGSLTTAPELLGMAVGDECGAAVASAGDLDGDGRSEFLVGAPGADRVYLLAGGDWAGEWDADLADVVLLGPAGTRAGEAVAGVGDVDGDGVADLAVGAPTLVGGVSLVSGAGLSGQVDLAVVATRTWLGETDGDRAGAQLAAAGDVDADGYADVWVGAPERWDGGVRPGGAYLVLGAASFGPGGLEAAGSVAVGVSDGDLAGAAVAGAGDVDADGHADLLVGAPGVAGEGQVALILGAAAPPPVVDLGAFGIALRPESAGGLFGASVAGVGDTNADGFDDLVVGSPLHDHAAVTNSGGAYLVLGQDL